MRPSRLAFASAPIPFRSSFGHAAARREQADNVLVLAEDEAGRFGIGEGCPRSYVTGETADSARGFLEAHRRELSDVDGVPALRDWMARRSAEIDLNPSAFCAVELALLDLFARQNGQSIEALLGLSPLRSNLTTTAVYGTGSWAKFAGTALLFAGNGMREAKLKLGGDAGRDAQRAAILAKLGRVRLDANNLWPSPAEAIAGLSPAARHAWAVEEPVRPRDWEGLREVGARTGLAIILDESFTRGADLEEAPAGPSFTPNLRVSKLGGLLRSLDALRLALEQGRTVIVGAQVGETSILARAGMTLASAAADRLVGFEGCYGTWLLTEDAVTPSLRFGRRGRVDARKLSLWQDGMGLSPSGSLERLRHVSGGRIEVERPT
jgi:L-Ala-D/L-Glu epimerase